MPGDPAQGSWVCRVQESPGSGSLGWNSKKHTAKREQLQEREGQGQGQGWGRIWPPLNVCPPLPKLALGAALVNVQIPLLLGQLVEIVAKYTRDHVGSFLTESRNLSTYLLILYGIQVQQEGGPGGTQRSLLGAPECPGLSPRAC